MKGTSSLISAGLTSRACMSQFLAELMRRRSSSIRSGVRATSMPPQVTLTPIASYWRWLSMVSIAISLL